MVTPIFELCDESVTRSARLDPIFATMRGIVGDFGAGTDYGPDGVEARAALVREILARLDTLEPTNSDDVLAASFLRERMTAHRDTDEMGEQLRSVRAPFGLFSGVRDSVDLLPRDTPEQWAAVADRLAAIPSMLDSWQQSLRLGLSRGLRAARRQALEAADQADRFAGGNGAAPTFDILVASCTDEAMAERLRAAAQQAHAAFALSAAFLREEYAPAADPADGVGPERYAVASRASLGASIDPVEAYAWAWDELYRIEDELAAEAKRVRTGISDDEAAKLLDQTEYVEGLDAYRDWLQARHDEALSRLDGVHFDLHPALRRVEVVLAVSSNSGAAYYTAPSEDLTRPGRTWWPLGGRNRFSTWTELTTVFHEGVPGHHLQLGAARVAGDRLSRYSRTSGVSGHGEGWALYAERLADELGWFDEAPGSRLGMLRGSALRAARVIVDIGLHLDLAIPPAEATRYGPRWTFEVGCQVLTERGRLASHRVHPEMVRYCGWPAQATAYKLGERAWLGARADAMKRLGRDFDLKSWHTNALALGPIGLDGLAQALAGVA